MPPLLLAVKTQPAPLATDLKTTRNVKIQYQTEISTVTDQMTEVMRLLGSAVEALETSWPPRVGKDEGYNSRRGGRGSEVNRL